MALIAYPGTNDSLSMMQRVKVPVYTIGVLLLTAGGYLLGAPKALLGVGLIISWILCHFEIPSERVAGFSVGAGMSLLLVLGTVTVPKSLLQYAVLIAIAGWAIAIMRTREERSRAQDAFQHGLLLCLVVMTVVDGIRTSDTSLFRYSLRYALPLWIVFSIARCFTVAQLRAFVVTMYIFTASQLMTAALEVNGARIAPYPSYDLSNLTAGNNLTGGGHRAEAMMSHPIPFSLLLVFMCCFTWTKYGFKNRWVRIAFTLASLWGVIESGSRSAFAAVAAILVLSLVSSRVPRRARILGASVTAIAVIAYAVSLTARGYVDRVLNALGASGSYSHRSNSIDAISKILNIRHGFQYLFGSGIGSEHSPPYVTLLHLENFPSVDNQFTSSLVWGGVVGLGALVIAVLAAYWRALGLSRALIATMIVYMFSFDLLLWSGEALMLVVALGLSVNSEISGLSRRAKRRVPVTTYGGNDQDGKGVALSATRSSAAVKS